MRSLRLQLLVSHMLLVLLFAAMMSTSVLSLFSLSSVFDRVLARNFETILGATEVERSAADQEATLRLLAENRGEKAMEVYATSVNAMEEGLRHIEATVDSGTEQSVANRMADLIAEYDGQARKLIVGHPRPALSKVLRTVDDQLVPRLSEIRKLSAELTSLNRDQIRIATDEAKRDAQAAAWRAMVVSAIGIILAILLALRMVQMALKPLAILARHAEAVASGDLTQHVALPRQDEVGALADTFNEMVSKLAEVRRAQSRRIQRAEQMTDAALEHLYDPVLVTDAKGRLTYQNPAAEGLFGPILASPKKLVSEHVSDSRVVKAILHAISDETVSASEDERAMVPVSVGGASRTYRLRVTPMKGKDGIILGAVAVFEDVTHIKVIDRMKTDFIGVASHELRTPITSLLLSNDLLTESELPEPLVEIVQAQREDLVRLSRLIKELLDISKLEAGSSPPRLCPVTPSDLVTPSVEGLMAEAHKKGVELEVRSSSEQGTLRADPSQIGQVVTNLVSNAIRHTPSGGKIVVETLATPDEVILCVGDTGDGIPKEYLSQIFERFVQVPGATQGGAGLGLSISQQIVRAHGGQMTVESEVGKGSKFSVRLPRDPTASSGEDSV